MKISVIIIGLILLLLSSIVYIAQTQLEGFDTTKCSDINNDKTCLNSGDCSWVNNKCLSCADIIDCGVCSTTSKCGWCSDVNKCVTADRMGLPVGRVCSELNYVVVADQCPGVKKVQPKLDMSKIPDANQLQTDRVYGDMDTSLPILTYSNTVCPDSEAIVEHIKDKIITLVKTELVKNGVTPVEGFTDLSGHVFTGQENTLGNDVIASISDSIRSLIQKSVASKNAV